jgi:glycosyltransferase involved in cell wall biosynthesis
MSKHAHVVLEYRFKQDSSGEIYTESAFSYDFWLRYLSVFKAVTIIARAQPEKEIDPTWKKVTGANVSFITVPYYHGLGDLLKRIRVIGKAIRQLPSKEDTTFIFRMPSIIGILIFFLKGKKFVGQYGVEMVGDPEEVFATLPFHFRAIGNIIINKTKAILFNAAAVAYVADGILPKKYPVKDQNNKFFFSSINLPDDQVKQGPKTFSAADNYLNLVSIGSLEQMYKGPDILLKALRSCKDAGMQFKLVWIGGGKYHASVNDMVNALGLQDSVKITGIIADRNTIDDYLDNADLFVLASRTEGLPRAMIEAMARALPCIGSEVGAIPELLTAKDMFAKEDIEALANKLMALASNKKQLIGMSAESLKIAGRYVNSVLSKQRISFYKTITA